MEKRVYQLDNKAQNNQTEDFYIVFKAKREEVNYLDKSFNKVVVNFVVIETVCIKYNIFFSSKSKLHKYLKADYIEIM